VTRDDSYLEQDFAAYVNARWARLVRSAVVLGCRLPEAEDATQEALLKAFVHWEKVVRADNRDAYVYRILVNTVTSTRRLRRSEETPSSWVDERGDAAPAKDFELADAVIQALRRLPLKYRTVVVLRHYVGFQDKDIADVLGIPLGTVKSRMSRAHLKLGEDASLAQTVKHGDER
jgi:RNA polymerase sigma-70 factor (sigma-E family)